MPGPNDRREPRKYVPPPWEEQPAAAEPVAPAQPATPAQPASHAAPQEATTEQPAAAPIAPEPMQPQPSAPEEEPVVPPAADNVPLDPETEARMEQLLANLSVHERVEHGVDTSKYGTILSVFVAFVGAVMTVWAIVVFARTSEAGFAAVTGSCLVGFMGLFMLGAAAWVAVRARKQRGA